MLRGMPIIDIHRNTTKLRKQRTEPGLGIEVSNGISSAVEDDEPGRLHRGDKRGVVGGVHRVVDDVFDREHILATDQDGVFGGDD